MKYVILCALFAPILYLAFRQKKWYLYLLFAFIGVLPEQFSVRLHESIPLLTANRALILIVLGFWLWDKWKTRKFSFPKSLVIFFAVSLLVSLVNLRYGTDEIKLIFLLIFERVFLVVILSDMIRDRTEFHRCIDFSIMGCAALAVIGIVQTVFDYDISSVLRLTETFSSVQLSDRMGLVRAFGTYNAISFGCYCAFMLLLILYRLYNTRSLWHSTAFALTFTALICTFTRSAWLCIGAIVFIILILYRTRLLRRLLSGLAITLALLTVLCCFQPKLYKAFVETGKSSINTVLSILPDSVVSLFESEDPTTPTKPSATPEDPDAPSTPTEPPETQPTEEEDSRPGFDLDEDFGLNAKDPSYSRNAQWTAVEYMKMEGEALFGYGYNALQREKIHVFYGKWSTHWQVATFIDVGMVAMITESGAIGFLAFMGLWVYMAVYAFRKRSKGEKFDFFRLVLFVIPLYLLLNILASFPNAGVVWLFIALFYGYRKVTTEEARRVRENRDPEQVDVSIYVPTFNHENYIVRALDSIRMQETKYTFEVFVGEDCSTDNTRQVLKDWEANNPDARFTILYREQNMHKLPVRNATDLKMRCKGRYLICLEGDDFWTDPKKLEKQVSFLEENPDYYAVAHNCTVVGADSEPNGEAYPQCKDEGYTFRHFASDILPGQYATLLARNYMIDPAIDPQLLNATGGAGDRRVSFTILCYGKIRCMQEAMSAYRHITDGGSSFSATHRYNYDALLKYNRDFLEFAYKTGNTQAIRCAEMLYLRTIRHAKRLGHIDKLRAKQDKAVLRCPLRASALLLKRDINCRILHRTLHI